MCGSNFYESDVSQIDRVPEGDTSDPYDFDGGTQNVAF